MPRVTYLQTNFTAGELSPRLLGRVDVARYANAVKRLVNGQVLVHGGVRRRLGTQYCGATKDSAKISRLIPFVVSRTLSFMLEFGDTYLRVWQQDGTQFEGAPSVPYEIVTPFTQSMLSQLDYTHGAETMFIWHPAVPTQRLQRFADGSWRIAAAPWVHQPIDEIGERINAVGTISGWPAFGTRQLTTSVNVFEPADVGRYVVSGTGSALIIAFTAANDVNIQHVAAAPMPAGTLAVNTWLIDRSPRTTCAPSAVGPVGSGVQLTAGANAWKTPAHIGAYVRVNGGLCLITGWTSALVVTATVINEMASTTAAPIDAWSLEFPVWNAFDGYPRTGTLWEQRLIAAGSARYPQTVWGTRTGEYLNFSPGVADDQGFSFTIASDELNPINYMIGGRALAALTGGGEFTLQGGIEKPITPTNVQIRARSNIGCAEVRPITVGREQLFMQRGGRKLRAFSYNVANDDYSSPDVSVLSEHITSPRVLELAWQQSPEAWLWAVRDDGRMVSCTYDRDQEVTAFAELQTVGTVESVAVMPDDNGEDQAWIIVNRMVDGTPERYVERFSAFYPVDCGMTQTSFTPETIWSGFDHLEGLDVDVVADGAYAGRFPVGAGAITLLEAAEQVIVGLPYTMTVELLPPEIGGPGGSAQGNSMRTGEITLRLLDSVGGTINGQVIPSRLLGPDAIGTPPISRSGLFRIENLGWLRGDSPVVIEQSLPMPFLLTAVIRKFTVND